MVTGLRLLTFGTDKSIMTAFQIPFYHRLPVRLSLVLIALLSSFVIASGWVTWQVEKKNVENNLVEAMRETILVAQGALAYGVWSYDKESVRQLTKLLAEAQKKMLTQIVIKDSTGEVLFEQTNPELNRENEKTFSAKLKLKDEVVGEVVVSFSAHKTMQELYNYTWKLIALSLIAIGCLSSIVLFTTDHLVAAPLKGLIESVKLAQADPSQYPEEDNLSGELHALSQSFHSAMKAIYQRDQQFKAFNQAKLASLGEMAAGIAHEINNPLAVIDAKAHTLKSLIEHSGEKAMMYQQIERIQAMVIRTSKIIKGLRAFACDGSKDPMGTFSLLHTISDSLGLCQSTLASRNIELILNLPFDYSIHGQQVQISHAVFNLVQNAIEAVQNEAQPRIRVSVSGTSEMCQVCVEDNGPGVADHIKDKIFQPFFTTKSVDQGTGLGLSVAHGIAKHHQGRLVYSRKEGKTQFILELPGKQIHKVESQAA